MFLFPNHEVVKPEYPLIITAVIHHTGILNPEEGLNAVLWEQWFLFTRNFAVMSTLWILTLTFCIIDNLIDLHGINANSW
ncbi:MAG: hypothetical protein PSX81_09810 [bacterium]|nr:hypothetical protein [bacterium]